MKPFRLTLPLLLAASTVLLGLFTLATWRLGAWQVATFGPNYVPMAPITAVFFVLLGLAQWARLLRPEHRLIRGCTIGMTGLVMLGATMILARAWLALPLSWENWFMVSAAPVGLIPVGQMAPLTAGVFLLTSAGLLVWPLRHEWLLWSGPLVAITAFLLATMVAAGYAAGTPISYSGETVPMALLTALTFMLLNLSLLLAGPLLELLHHWMKLDAAAQPDGQGRRFNRLLAVIFLTLVALILVFGFFYVRSEQTAARESIRRELHSVANLKVIQLSQWREERRSEGRFLQRTPAIAADIAAFLARPDDPAMRSRVIGWLEPIKGGERYAEIMLFDAEGHLRLVLPESNQMAAARQGGNLAAVRASGEVQLTDLDRDPADGRIHLSVVAPIFRPVAESGAAAAELMAVVELRLDPSRMLYPMIQSWPVPSETAEIILVRREGNEVVYLNELRHQPVPALTQRRSIQESFLPAARGGGGLREGRDYRGEAVLTEVQPIPDSSWILIAKIDQKEVYAPIRKVAWQSAIMVALLLVGVGLAAAFVWRQRHAVTLQRILGMERERAALAERLAQVMRHANDIILLLDEAGRIVEASDRAITAYGYTMEELSALPPGGLRSAGSKGDLAEHMQGFLTTEGACFETVHRRKDGSTLPMEVSGRAVQVGGRRFILGIYRDITERKAHERQIERFNHLYAALSQVNQAIVHATDRQGLFQEICRVLVKFGRFRMAWIGWYDPATAEVKTEAEFGDDTGYLKSVQIQLDKVPAGQGPTGTALRENRTYVCNDIMADPRMAPWHETAARAGYRSSIALPVRLGGVVCGVLSAYAVEVGFFAAEEIALLEEATMDVVFGLENLEREAQRRQAEAALRSSEERFRTIFNHAPVGISLTFPESGSIMVNAEHARITGVSVADSQIPRIFHRVTHPEDAARQMALAEKFIKGELGHYTVEKRYIHPDGRVQWAELTSRFYTDPATNRRVIVTIIIDIAARKEAEARLKQQLDELRRWHEATLDREDRIMEMKREVNELLLRAGLPVRYPSVAPGHDHPADE